MMRLNKKNIQSFFTKELLHWHFEENDRDFPWVGEKDPYKIWISEIMLQQTRAEQALPYYQRFMHSYPSLEKLAKAPLEEVLLAWEGLGYYSRCRNLHFTAQHIFYELKGEFPKTYEDLLKLKGVGPYTAAAIASFAFEEAKAVVDGNVYRVLARFFALDWDTSQGKMQKAFRGLADELIDKVYPAIYNQAIMDLGAVICKPKQPLCEECYLKSKCEAYQKDLIDVLPVKTKKIKIKKRYLNFFLLEFEDKIYIEQRKGKDIWQSLHQLYLIESKKSLSKDIEELLPNDWHYKWSRKIDFKYKQQLTHQEINSQFVIIELENMPKELENGLWVSKENLENFAFPKTIISFFQEKYYF